jgi:hypothetical protein
LSVRVRVPLGVLVCVVWVCKSSGVQLIRMSWHLCSSVSDECWMCAYFRDKAARDCVGVYGDYGKIRQQTRPKGYVR